MRKVVLIGGGHGLSNLVKGFKNEDIDLTIIVSSSDDGGHTGKIRNEFNTIAVGDLRMVLNELLDNNSILKDIFDYRFDNIHGVSGVSLGNLIILSLLLKYSDIDKVIDCFKEKENIKANIFVSSNNPLTLCAGCKDREIIKCEHIIGESNKKIESLYFESEANCNPLMLDKIEKADIIVLCPGSLYTSVGAVLCVNKIKESIKKSKASIVYVCNIMTQDGETLGYSVKEHEESLINIMDRNINRIIINNGKIPEDVLERYKEENSSVVQCDEIKDNYEVYNLVEIYDNKVRHNSELTKKIILFKDRQNKNIVL